MVFCEYIRRYTFKLIALWYLIATNVIIVRVCRRLINLDIYALLLLQLLPDVVLPVSLSLSLSSPHSIHPLFFTCENPHILAPASYLKDKTPYLIRSWHRHWTLSLYRFLGQP